MFTKRGRDFFQYLKLNLPYSQTNMTVDMPQMNATTKRLPNKDCWNLSGTQLATSKVNPSRHVYDLRL